MTLVRNGYLFLHKIFTAEKQPEVILICES